MRQPRAQHSFAKISRSLAGKIFTRHSSPLAEPKHSSPIWSEAPQIPCVNELHQGCAWRVQNWITYPTGERKVGTTCLFDVYIVTPAPVLYGDGGGKEAAAGGDHIEFILIVVKRGYIQYPPRGVEMMCRVWLDTSSLGLMFYSCMDQDNNW